MKSLLTIEPLPATPEEIRELNIPPEVKKELREEQKYQYNRLQAHFCAVPWQEVISYWFDEELKYWWNLANVMQEDYTMNLLKKQLGGRKIPAVLRGEDELQIEGWHKMMDAKMKLFDCKSLPTPLKIDEIVAFVDTIATYQFVRAAAYTSAMKPLTEDSDLQCPFGRHSFLPIKMMRTLIFNMARGRNPKPLL